MYSEPPGDCLDLVCEQYEHFVQIKTSLEMISFSYDGTYSKREDVYLKMIANEEVVKSHGDRPFPLDVALDQAREALQFNNFVQEHTWLLLNSGYKIIRTQGFEQKAPLDDLVAFFIMPPTKTGLL